MKNQEGPKGAAVRIEMKHHAYNPSSLQVAKGTQVVWHNSDFVPHTVTSDPDGKIFNSGIILPTVDYSYTFDTPGSYPYYCTIHKGMKGTIIVTK